MKRTKYLFIALFATIFIITGCNKDEDPKIIEEDISADQVKDISLSDEALAQILDEVNQPQLKNGDELFYMVWDFGPHGDIIDFHSKMVINVDNASRQILFSVTYYWDETASGTNKWKRIPNSPSIILLGTEVLPGNQVYHCGSYLWNPGDTESFSLAIYQYDTISGDVVLKNIEWKIDVIIDWLIW